MPHLAAQSLALALGVSTLVMVLSRKLRIPALLLLLGIGLGLGRSGLRIIDGASLGRGLDGFISVAIGLLIFEGALHLNREELSHAPRAVWSLLTIGAAVTWAASTALAHYLLGFAVPTSILLGATVIVTGPTVVQPILRVVRVSPKLNAVLGAEAVLIDPLGVAATITTLELIRTYLETGIHDGLAWRGVVLMLRPLLGGAGVGIAMGILGSALLRLAAGRSRPDPHALNLIGVGVCMSCVGAGEYLVPDSGLAAVTICGVLMARVKVLGATELRAFKELLATMLVGTLFLLLASRFDVAYLHTLSWREVAFVAALLLVVRPLCIGLSTIGSKLTLRERVFASFFAPRGIVALSVATVAASKLDGALALSVKGEAPGWVAAMTGDAARFEIVIFAVIAGTVGAGTLLAPLMAIVLGVRVGRGNAVLLVGGHALSIALAKTLREHGVHARIIDSNAMRVAEASGAGIEAMQGDATDSRWLDDAGAPHDAGWALAWTGNDTVDQVVARWGEERFGPEHAAIWSQTALRPQMQRLEIGGSRLLSDAIDLVERGRAVVSMAPDAECFSSVIGWIDHGTLSLASTTSRRPRAGDGVRFFGLRPVAEPSPEPGPLSLEASSPIS